MDNLDALLKSDRAHLFHPSTDAAAHAAGSLPGIIVTDAVGVRVRDHRGRELIDAFAGLYCVNIGYGRTEVAEAIYAQAKRLAYYHTYVGHGNEPAIELAERVIAWSPPGMKKVYFGLSGSDANETQVKLVRYYNNILGRPAKKKIISRERGYHGSGIMTGSLTGLPVFHEAFDLPVADVRHTLCPHWYRYAAPGMDEAAFSAHCAAELEQLVLAEGPDTVAAFIGEPVLGTGGRVPPPQGYWEAVQAVLDKYDILLIADEVVCGFGRIGTPMGSHRYAMRPDLISLAKGLTSAYAPLSAVVVGERVWEVIEEGARRMGPLGHGWTYSGHPVCAAAGVANLDVLEREKVMASAAETGAYLQARLHQAFDGHPLVGEVRGVGMLAALEFMADGPARKPFDPALRVGQRVSAACNERGLIARAMPHGDILGFAPPLVATREDVDEIVAIAREGADAVGAQL